MPVAKIHVLKGQYDEARLGKVSRAIQDGLMSALGVPPDDFFQRSFTFFLEANSSIRRRSWASNIRMT
jgi:hypothetical protein